MKTKPVKLIRKHRNIVISKKNDSNLNNKFSESLKIIATTIIPIIVAIYGAVSIIANYSYKALASEYYGISPVYFSCDTNIPILHFSLFAFALYFLFFPFIYRNIFCKDKIVNTFSDKLTIILFIISSIMILLILTLLSLYAFIDKSFYTNECTNISLFLNDKYISIMIVLFLLFVTLGICIYYLVVRKFPLKKSDKKVAAQNKIVIVAILLSLFTILFCNIEAMLFIYRFPTENERNFEFFKTNDTEYVVITHYNDKILAVPCECDDKGLFTFYTKNYSLFDPNDCLLDYQILSKEPKIEKNITFNPAIKCNYNLSFPHNS